jgi:hypothetical protein
MQQFPIFASLREVSLISKLEEGESDESIDSIDPHVLDLIATEQDKAKVMMKPFVMDRITTSLQLVGSGLHSLELILDCHAPKFPWILILEGLGRRCQALKTLSLSIHRWHPQARDLMETLLPYIEPMHHLHTLHLNDLPDSRTTLRVLASLPNLKCLSGGYSREAGRHYRHHEPGFRALQMLDLHSNASTISNYLSSITRPVLQSLRCQNGDSQS